MDQEFSGVPMVEGLFGPQPLVKLRKQGRPPHVWSRANSLRICNLFACGYTVEQASAVIGISQPTFRKVYFQELATKDIMALKVRSEQMLRLTEAAIAGSVPAEKALAGMIQSEQIKLIGDRFGRSDADDAGGRRREPRINLGKKEEANLAAAGAGLGTDWGDDLQPSLIN